MIKIPDKCLQCGQTYKKKDADLISEGDNVFVFHVTCSVCKTSAILNIAVSKEGVLSLGTITDAGKEDLDKLRDSKAISADDVIKAYMALKSSNYHS